MKLKPVKNPTAEELAAARSFWPRFHEFCSAEMPSAEAARTAEQPATAEQPENRLAEFGRIWERGAHRRLYVRADVAARLIGLEVSRYNSGAISYATRDGREISNNEARRLLAAVDGCWYDLNARAMHGDVDGRIQAAVEAAIA